MEQFYVGEYLDEQRNDKYITNEKLIIALFLVLVGFAVVYYKNLIQEEQIEF